MLARGLKKNDAHGENESELSVVGVGQEPHRFRSTVCVLAVASRCVSACCSDTLALSLSF